MKATISQKQIQDLVYDNKYKIPSNTECLSRCIDGRYSNDKNLHPLAIPGADAGELAILFATANVYGFTLNTDKAFEALIEVIGGYKNFSFHTDTHAIEKNAAAGCGHMKQIRSDFAGYSLESSQIAMIEKYMGIAQKKGAQETVLQGDHQEGAILQIVGDWNVHPQYYLHSAHGTKPIQIFVFHKTLVDKRHRILAKKLVETKAVELFDDLDEEYLYEVLSSMTEDHLLETAKRLAQGLPIYEAIFEIDGNYTIETRGIV